MVAALRPAVFLDRDGVLIRTNVVGGKPFAIRDVAEYEILPGVADATARLKAAGYVLIVVTNQPDIDNGLVDPKTVEIIHTRLMTELPLDAVRMCPHDKRRNCVCRKPLPGMLVQAAKEFQLDLGNSWMVGDRASDVAAGKSAGCRSIFIECNYAETGPVDHVAKVGSLAEAADIILTSESL